MQDGSTNPKHKYGVTKPNMGLVPRVAMIEMTAALELGAKKYGEFNWRGNPIDAMTYLSAALRHLEEWKEVADNDEESMRSHLGHAMACCAILLDADNHRTLVDNRPPKRIDHNEK